MELTATEIWEKYRRGVDWHHKNSIYTKADKCHRFYEGDQWSDSNGSLGDDLARYNFIKPTVDYKTAMIAQNSMVINYSPNSADETEMQACNLLNGYAAKKWDRLKMDTKLWEVVKEGAITGDSFIYFYDDALSSQMLETDNVYLGDEQQQDIQKQPYIIVQERRLVSDVREEARQNGMSEEDIEQIQQDTDENDLNAWQNEVKGDGNEKCTTLLYITRGNGNVMFCRSTQAVMFQQPQVIKGMSRYPIAKFTWLKKHGSSRGVGEVWWLIPNQVEVNKTLYRRTESVKATAFPKPVYVEGQIENPDGISTVGTPVRVKYGSVNKVQEVFTYLQPAAISGDAKALQEEMMQTTRDLANAGDNAMGNINPEQASGAAIAAVKDAQAVPLNEQKSAAKQFVEDIALIWLDMLTAYGVNGIDTEDGTITGEMLEGLEPEIRIDVSDGNPYSRYARQQALDNALAAGYISFEEYVNALDEDANAPKAKFSEILKAREAQQEMQMEMPVSQAEMPVETPEAFTGELPMEATYEAL